MYALYAIITETGDKFNEEEKDRAKADINPELSKLFTIASDV